MYQTLYLVHVGLWGYVYTVMRPLYVPAIGAKIVSRCAAPQPALTRYKLLEIEQRCKAGSVTPAQNNCASQAIIADHTHVNDGAVVSACGAIA